MTRLSPRYSFATPAQWETCLTTALGETLVLDPDKGAPAGEAPPCGARAFAAAPDGELFWVDLGGRVTAGGCAGPALGRVRRLVAGRDRLWTRTGHIVIQLDRRTLQPLLKLHVRCLEDVAPAECDGLWLLRRRRVWRINACGRRVGPRHLLEEWAISLAAAGGKLAALSRDRRRLALIAPSKGSSLTVDLDALIAADDARRGVPAGAGFVASRLVGGRGRFLLQGRWKNGGAGFLLLDPDGSLAARATWDGAPPFGLGLSGSDLLAAFGRRRAPTLRRFATMAQAGGQVLLTPALETETLSGGWQQAEVGAWLPEAATLAMRWAATSDEGLRASVERTAAARTIPDSAKLEQIGRLLEGCWSRPFTYVGEAGQSGEAAERFTFPIDAPGRSIAWVELRLMRNGAAAPPRLDALSVLHDGASLIDHLPAIYRGLGDGDGTMRRLTGVLEATTQDIDARIAQLAERLDPARADARWLPGLAAMLGLPFDAALSETMQRGLLGAARAILTGRGARRGLVALIEALFPGRPAMVVDRTPQLSPIALGGAAFGGSHLPALLAGPPSRLPKLSARLVLGRTALCAADPCGEGLIAPLPEVSVTIPASSAERRRYGPAVRQMLTAMIPAGVRLRLRWTAWNGAAGAGATEVPTSVGAPRPLRIGDGQPLGVGAVGGRTDARIDREGTTSVRHRLL